MGLMPAVPLTFVVREERFALTAEEVEGIFSRAVSREIPAQTLHSNLKSLIRTGEGEFVVRDDGVRAEIVRCLNEVERERGELTETETTLREALTSPRPL
jgi:hypothetical protein